MDLVKLRYIGADRRRVPKLGRVVEPDELVGVPRDVFDRYAWSESQWQRVDDDGQRQGQGQGEQAGAGEQESSADQGGAKTRKAGGRDA